MTVEIEFNTGRAYDNTPEFRAKAYGGPASVHISPGTPNPTRIATRISANKIVVVLEGLDLPDISQATENNFIGALEGNIPNCVHERTREVPKWLRRS